MSIKVGLLLSAILASILFYHQVNDVSENELYFIRRIVNEEERVQLFVFMRDSKMSRWEYNILLARVVDRSE